MPPQGLCVQSFWRLTREVALIRSGGVTTMTSPHNALFPDVAASIRTSRFGRLGKDRSRPTYTDGMSKYGRVPLQRSRHSWNTHCSARFYPDRGWKALLFLRGNYQQDVIGGLPQVPDRRPSFLSPYRHCFGHPGQ